MKLTDGERLIVVMLAEVMETLKLDRTVDPTLVKNLASEHDEWAISKTYYPLFNSAAPPQEEVDETVNILWMWQIIENSIRQLAGNEAIEAAAWRGSEFGGFDANHGRHYGIARTLIDQLGQHSAFKGRELNSHNPASLSRYRQMFVKFQGYVCTNKASPLDFAALRDLCT